MKQKCEKQNIQLRPHFKTHQSAQIGNILREEGITKITVSNVQMAFYFAKNGWDNITIAFPLNIKEFEQIQQLNQHIKQLNILIDQEYTSNFLKAFRKQQNSNKLGVFIKIDVGYNRCGIEPENINLIKIIVQNLKENGENIEFKGFLTHTGQSYNEYDINIKIQMLEKSVTILDNLKQQFIKEFPNIIISLGDTPSFSICNELSKKIDECRPGNFVLYDTMQTIIGSCDINDIAICVACPVVSVYEHRKEIVVYGGGIHLAKDFQQLKNGKKIYGYVSKFEENNKWVTINNSFVRSLSQDHGVIYFENENDMKEFKVGDIIGILPVHSCMTVGVSKRLWTTCNQEFTTILNENELYPCLT